MKQQTRLEGRAVKAKMKKRDGEEKKQMAQTRRRRWDGK